VDSTPPVIAFTNPAQGAEYTISSLPGYISLSYSDTQSAVRASTLDVTFSVNGRSVDISDLFGKDDSLNAVSTQTSRDDPLSITVVSRYGKDDTDFSRALDTAAVRRAGAGSLRITCDDLSSNAVVWNPAAPEIYIVAMEGELTVTPVALGLAPAAAATAGEAGRIYLSHAGFNGLSVYSGTSGQWISSIPLPDQPALLEYHPRSGKIYVGYKTDARISRIETSDDSLDEFSVNLEFPPVLLGTRRGQGDASVFAVAVSGSRFHLFEFDATGGILRDVALKQTQPQDMEFVASGHIYLSNFSDNTVTRVVLSDNSSEEIQVGRLPRKMFRSGPDSAYVINSGDRTISEIRGAVAGAPTRMEPFPIDGNADCSRNFKFVLEDILSVTSRIPGTITASVGDSAGNRGTAGLSIFIKPESIGMRMLNPAAPGN